MQVVSPHSVLFSILLLFVDFSCGKEVTVYGNMVNSTPQWGYSRRCHKSYYLSNLGDEASFEFVGIRIRINFQSTDLNYTNEMLAQISINNTDVAIVNTSRRSFCTSIPWTSGYLSRGLHTLRVTQLNDSDHIYIQSLRYTWIASETPRNELKCYGLPYGALGFASHLLALYSSLCLINRRKAYFPWSRIEPGKRVSFDAVLSAVTFIATVTLTSITMARCKNNWQYILLAMENFFLSIALSAMSLSSSLKTSNESHFMLSSRMCIFAFIGAGIGTAGYVSLLVQNWSNESVRIAFGSVCGGGFVLGILTAVITICQRKLSNIRILTILVFFHLFAVSMTDWVVGAIADDVSGIPDGKIAILIWLYFAMRNLPMLIS